MLLRKCCLWGGEFCCTVTPTRKQVDRKPHWEQAEGSKSSSPTLPSAPLTEPKWPAGRRQLIELNVVCRGVCPAPWSRKQKSGFGADWQAFNTWQVCLVLTLQICEYLCAYPVPGTEERTVSRTVETVFPWGAYILLYTVQWGEVDGQEISK